MSLSDKLSMIHHYDVKFEPSELKPAKISWKIIETWSEKYREDLKGIRPVFDGKANLYTAKLLPHKQVMPLISSGHKLKLVLISGTANKQCG